MRHSASARSVETGGTLLAAFVLQQWNQQGLSPARPQHPKPDDTADVREEEPNEHLLGPRALLGPSS